MIGETFQQPADPKSGKWWSLAEISAVLTNRYPNYDPETPFKKIGNTLNDIQFNFKSLKPNTENGIDFSFFNCLVRKILEGRDGRRA